MKRALWCVVFLRAAAAIAAMGLAGCGQDGATTASANKSPAIPELSGLWAREFFGFEQPESGVGPLALFHLPDGKVDPARAVADYTNTILKPAAAERVKALGEIELSGRSYPMPQNQCAPEQMPFVVQQQEFQLIQLKDEVVILYMNDAQVRHIRLNANHPAKLTRSWSGDSIGHYENDTLVVDTVGVRIGPLSMLDAFGTPQSEAMHAVERYRLIDRDVAIAALKRSERDLLHFAGNDGTGDGVMVDPGYTGKALQLELTVEDPNALNMPWSAVNTYQRAAGEFAERICAENLHEADGSIRHVPTAATPDF